MRVYYIYIVASINRVLYIEVTNNLERRLNEHRSCVKTDSFAARYRGNRLVYYEEYTRVADAIAREKQLKSWNRSKKLTLIKLLNPDWQDLLPPDHQIPRLRSG